jgi:hypothetical protein
VRSCEIIEKGGAAHTIIQWVRLCKSQSSRIISHVLTSDEQEKPSRAAKMFSVSSKKGGQPFAYTVSPSMVPRGFVTEKWPFGEKWVDSKGVKGFVL